MAGIDCLIQSLIASPHVWSLPVRIVDIHVCLDGFLYVYLLSIYLSVYLSGCLPVGRSVSRSVETEVYPPHF